MTEIYQKLLRLLQQALWSIPFKDQITTMEAGELIALADKQAISGLIINALIKNDVRMEQQTLFEAIGFLEQIEQGNKVQNREVATLTRFMADSKTEYVVVKGQTMAALYPEPLVRMSGDIDFFINDYQHTSKVLKENWGVELPRQMFEKEVAFTHGKALYELHTYLIDFGCKKHQRVWESIIAEEWKKEHYVEINGFKVRTLSPTINAVYIFLHLYFHLIREGVSLRQFCDWAIMLHHYRNKIDKDVLKEILQQLDMIRGYRAFGTILVDDLGLPEEEFPLSLAEKDRGMKERILEDIFQGGNFGKHNHKAKSSLGFKMETFRMALNNSIRYYSLAPSEMCMMIPKMLRINLKLLFG